MLGYVLSKKKKQKVFRDRDQFITIPTSAIRIKRHGHVSALKCKRENQAVYLREPDEFRASEIESQ